MKKSKFTGSQIAAVLKQGDGGHATHLKIGSSRCSSERAWQIPSRSCRTL